ncbi:hypothetical protein AB0F43_03795 [Kribbella sp. NPDC023972]|uniref:hypothetical protein n=1 Tax=Kribbella sp. NPDC023972 TaxID=3154795 RepID=UPI0033E286D2
MFGIGEPAGRIALATGLLTAATVTIGGIAASQASAAGCYDSKKFFEKKSGTTLVPQGISWFRTTSNCRDINVQSAMWMETGANVTVCFRRSGCQDRWTWIPAGGKGWKVVASNVKDGTDYRFEFASTAGWQGYRAE